MPKKRIASRKLLAEEKKIEKLEWMELKQNQDNELKNLSFASPCCLCLGNMAKRRIIQIRQNEIRYICINCIGQIGLGNIEQFFSRVPPASKKVGERWSQKERMYLISKQT